MDTHPSETGKDVARYHALFKKGSPGEHAYVVLLGLDAFDLPVLLRLIGKGLSWKTLFTTPA